MVSLLAACSGGMQSIPTANHLSAVPITQSHVMNIDGITAHVMFARDYAGTTGTAFTNPARLPLARATKNSNLTWRGGPVQTTPKVYIVFWGPKWTTSDGEYKALTGFFTAMGGKGWIGIDTQYTGSNGAIGNPSNQLAGTWIDTSTPPSRPSSSAVAAEAQSAVQHFGYGGVSANYVVAIQSGNDPSGFRAQWCAWHSSENEPEGVVSFTDFPYQSDAGASCGEGSVNNPGTYDGVSIVGGHEEAETQTDPQPNSGWLDGNNEELADKCAWQNLIDNSAAGGYPTQPLWDNKKGACAQSGP
jgi:serine protease